MKNMKKYVLIIVFSLILTACSSGSDGFVKEENLSDEEKQKKYEEQIKEENLSDEEKQKKYEEQIKEEFVRIETDNLENTEGYYSILADKAYELIASKQMGNVSPEFVLEIDVPHSLLGQNNEGFYLLRDTVFQEVDNFYKIILSKASRYNAPLADGQTFLSNNANVLDVFYSLSNLDKTQVEEDLVSKRDSTLLAENRVFQSYKNEGFGENKIPFTYSMRLGESIDEPGKLDEYFEIELLNLNSNLEEKDALKSISNSVAKSFEDRMMEHDYTKSVIIVEGIDSGNYPITYLLKNPNDYDLLGVDYQKENIVETKISSRVAVSESVDTIATVIDRMLVGLPEAITQHRDKMVEAFSVVQEVKGTDDTDYQDAGYEKRPTVKGETFVFYPTYNMFGEWVDIHIRMFTDLEGNLVPVVTPLHTPFIESMLDAEWYMPELFQ